MAITGTLLTIDGLSVTDLKKFDVEYNKLWKDADRNMSGDVRATLIGVFPKIVVQTNKRTLSQIQALCAKLDKPFFSVTFKDPATGTNKTANYYASDYKVSLEDRATERFGEVDFSLVPLRKRS